MFDIAWSELALIAVVALVVIGPKDLPKVMRTLGQLIRKMRLLAGEFQHNFDDMVRQAELEEIRKQVQSVNPAQIKDKIIDMVGDVNGTSSGTASPSLPDGGAGAIPVSPAEQTAATAIADKIAQALPADTTKKENTQP